MNTDPTSPSILDTKTQREQDYNAAMRFLRSEVLRLQTMRELLEVVRELRAWLGEEEASDATH